MSDNAHFANTPISVPRCMTGR